ncbi:Oligopeptide-binding protein AppA [Usitatibacter rugosus]|uniref:Oligopeptide-binding protein AppA n=1 Tax=Usitatibacter rugosus TaxID=2732067 RepID=A0A6M4GSF2_9PROT|nr:peptide ABC transporter substrate-binding protein [Usitatibacter rugosus]QJR10032.1 Oligopeptide-binding protein AppA [Usitatibacter rugosus]
MNEQDIRGLVEDVREGRISRREFIHYMIGAGLSVPMAGTILMHSGVANAQAYGSFAYKPTKRGGGGVVKLLMWQGPTLLNPHFATGTKDQYGSRMFYEPLAAWDGDGNLVPLLAAEIPSLANGGVGKDGKTVTWKLKKGVTWHDGKPFTADDVIFNHAYASDPATACTTISSYKDNKVEKIDSHTVKVTFNKPTPFWADPFVGTRGCIIPKHLFEAFSGAKSRDAPANLKPVGTGPYLFVDFRPGDLVSGKIYPNYHEANRPHFDAFEMKGGGDAVSAARAVLQTGEFDYAWNMQVEDEILLRLEAGGKGKVNIVPGGGLEMVQLNYTDPWNEVEGERASLKSKHPSLTDPAVREAFTLLIDRVSIQQHIYGRTGISTRNFVNQPTRFASKDNKFEFNTDKAAAILEAAGWKKGSDGIRAKDGKKLKYVFQTSINAPRQKVQQIIKQACTKVGIDLELKQVVASVFFSSDVANVDTYTKFFCDVQMYQTTQTQPDPEIFINQFCSWEASTKENKWQGRNITRYINADFDKIFRQAEAELDPVKRSAMFVEMNENLVKNRAIYPLVNRPAVHAVSNKMRLPLTGWDNDTAFIKDWFREG